MTDTFGFEEQFCSGCKKTKSVALFAQYALRKAAAGKSVTCIACDSLKNKKGIRHCICPYASVERWGSNATVSVQGKAEALFGKVSDARLRP